MDKDRLGTDETFLAALQYELFTIPEYWIKKQQESGWSRQTYLELLRGQHSHYLMELQRLKEIERKKDPTIESNKIGRSLAELTNGKVTEARTLKGNDTTILNNELLESLFICLHKAYEFGKPAPVYTDLQIVSFALKAVFYILSEIKIQAGLMAAGHFSRNPPKDFMPFSKDGEKMYLIHDYSLIQPSPVFDYFLFEDALRSLMLNSINSENLKKITKPLFNMSEEVVKLWNDKVGDLHTDFEVQKSNVKKSRQFIEFDIGKRWFKTWRDTQTFVKMDAKNFDTFDLVLYASRVGGIVASEIMGRQEDSPKPKKANPKVFSEIFEKDENYISSIRALRELNLIDENNANIIGTPLKGVMQVLVDFLRYERRYLKHVPDALLTVLLNKEFPGLNLSERADGKHFRNPINQDADKKYRSKLVALIR